jgi:hypothetical protein
MSYTSGGLIEATDYNTLAWGGATEAYRSSPNNLAYVWGVGNGQFGYGQSTTPFNIVSASNTVTATQWAGLVNATQNALQHQNQTPLMGGGDMNHVAGEIITSHANVTTAMTTINTNKLSYHAQGSTTTGGNFAQELDQGTNAAYSTTWTRTVTFASGDAARYFFNAGGQINWEITSATNNNGTTRSASTATLFATNLAGGTIKAIDGDGSTGTGGTRNTDRTDIGYWDLTAADVEVADINSGTAGYTTDVVRVDLRSNGTQGSNGDVGSTVTIEFFISSAARALNFNAVLDVTVNHRVNIVYPSSTYLATSSWGTPTVS